MRPDAQQAMRDAIALGPGHCPLDLFAGPVASIVRGLKAHANGIAHARHVALEETFPRARALMGAEAFHSFAEIHLAAPGSCRLALARIGQGFPERLQGRARDLAAVEFAWLEAHGAPEAPPFDLAAIASLNAAAIESARVSLHPACRFVDLSCPADCFWDGAAMNGSAVLVTRPYTEVILAGTDEAVSSMVRLVDRPHLLGELLDLDQSAATILVCSGALALSPEIVL